MSFGMDVGVKRTRAYTGDNTSGFAKSAATAEETTAPVAVNVGAMLATDGTYALTVEASGESATVTGVEPERLAERIARLVTKVSKASQAGELTKNRQRDSSPLGLGAPRSNRDNMRFAG